VQKYRGYKSNTESDYLSLRPSRLCGKRNNSLIAKTSDYALRANPTYGSWSLISLRTLRLCG
jgi:hypothetical protein